MLEVSRYIHNNPVKAKLEEKPGGFKWSSYNIYVGKARDDFDLVDTSKILGFFRGSRMKSGAEYQKFVAKYSEFDGHILDINEEHQKFEQEERDRTQRFSLAKGRIEQMLVEEEMTMEKLLENKALRNEMIRTARKNHALNLKELGKLFGGISESQVSRIVVS